MFAQVLAAQVFSVAGVVLLLGVLFYLDRNLTLARLIAERWAPALQQAAGSAPAAASQSLPQVLQSAALPAHADLLPGRAPRMAELRERLQGKGVTVTQLAMVRGEPQTLWLQVRGPAGTRWLGIREPLVEPYLPLRVALALALGLLLVLAVSAWQAWRLARPLEVLRQRMAAHRPGDMQAAAPERSAAGTGSSEIAAIGAAWQQTQARLSLHERERALMLAGISHDLRSPLTRIRLAAALLPDGPGVAERRSSIERNVAAMDRLLQGFLDHAQAADVALDQPLELVELLQRVARQALDAALAEDTAALPGGQPLLRTELPAQLMLPAAHPWLLERLVANLLDNARQHGRPPWVLRAELRQQEVVIEVQDAGPGIAVQDREAVLQAFYRGDVSRGRPGSGLGLAVVRDGVARLGGRIEFAHDAPRRHVVRLCLPLARGPHELI